MDIKGQCHSLTFTRGHSVFKLNLVFLKTKGLFETKYHVNASGSSRTKLNTAGLGHLTKMVSSPIYCKNIINSPSPELISNGLETWSECSIK